jgi:hypothetical protein
MVKGRLDRKASTATGYGWLVWEKDWSDGTALIWIPPCRKDLERGEDYTTPTSFREANAGCGTIREARSPVAAG